MSTVLHVSATHLDGWTTALRRLGRKLRVSLGWMETLETPVWELPIKRIESHKPGYPQFTALISAHDSFFLCRRFSRLRARVLLRKQDALSMLEQRLDEIDEEEQSLLCLGRSRSDTNTDRTALLSEIEKCFAEYDSFIERSHRILSISKAPTRDVANLQNWVDGTGAIAREETEFLGHRDELMSLVPPADIATSRIESWVEDMLIRFYRGFRENPGHGISSDPHVYIYTGPLIRRLARALLLLLIIMLLLLPVVICNSIDLVIGRLVVVFVGTAVLLVMLSALLNVRTNEIILAGATYATIMVVFVGRAA